MQMNCKYCHASTGSRTRDTCRKCSMMLIQAMGFLRRYSKNKQTHTPEEILIELLNNARIRAVVEKLDSVKK